MCLVHLLRSDDSCCVVGNSMTATCVLSVCVCVLCVCVCVCSWEKCGAAPKRATGVRTKGGKGNEEGRGVPFFLASSLQPRAFSSTTRPPARRQVRESLREHFAQIHSHTLLSLRHAHTHTHGPGMRVAPARFHKGGHPPSLARGPKEKRSLSPSPCARRRVAWARALTRAHKKKVWT